MQERVCPRPPRKGREMTRQEMAEEIKKRDRLLEAARDERDRVEMAVRWALGEAAAPDGEWFGDSQRTGVPYWWRRKLRELAFGPSR